MWFQAERALKAGRSAWMRGELETALSSLQSALKDAETAPEVLYPLARVLSEQGNKKRALKTLDQAAGHEHFSSVGEVFRALILYDHDEKHAARELLEQREQNNVLANALLALANFQPEDRKLKIFRGARWVSDTAGRILALFEERLHQAGFDKADAFHHRIFTEDADDTSSKTTSTESQGTNQDPQKFRSNADWWTAIEQALLRQDYDGIIRLYDRSDIPEKWRKDVTAGLYKTFSLLVTEREDLAQSLLAKLQKKNPSVMWVHFIAGITHCRRQERRQAIHSFVRATRLDDTMMDEVLYKLAGELGVEIELVD